MYEQPAHEQATSREGPNTRRSRRPQHGEGPERRKSNVDAEHPPDDGLDAKTAIQSSLIEMRTMCLPNALPLHKPAQERDGRVGKVIER